MELYLLRHGATAGNLLGQYIGLTDQPLSEDGVVGARAWTGRYPTPERLWVSPMLRARETAGILFPGMPQHVIRDLRELDFGDWEGHTWEEVGDPAVYDALLSGDLGAGFPGGETMGAFGLRTAEALQTILSEAEFLGIQRGAIVAHGGVLMSLMFQFGRPKRGSFFDWMTHNCGGFRVEADRTRGTLALLEEFGT